MELWTAFTIGFFGSFHCIGMCGPIAMALPVSGEGIVLELFRKTVYNLGRVITYSLMGAVVGLVGHGISLAGLQRPLSILLGILLIAGASLPMLSASGIQQLKPVRALFRRLRSQLANQMNRRGTIALLLVGLLNGLLPCGFVYVGLAGSATVGTVPGGMAYMALFGLGTLPAMMLMSLAPNILGVQLRRSIARYLPWLAVLLGLYLVYRGLFMGVMH
ncbi:MAG: sulfite exporter TauE/SafE family protein [Balneolaceae bacterium]|nr:sulfite exporter TauE/SafE family protein [Balneolaceae bacterium]